MISNSSRHFSKVCRWLVPAHLLLSSGTGSKACGCVASWSPSDKASWHFIKWIIERGNWPRSKSSKETNSTSAGSKIKLNVSSYRRKSRPCEQETQDELPEEPGGEFIPERRNMAEMKGWRPRGRDTGRNLQVEATPRDASWHGNFKGWKARSWCRLRKE